MGSIFVVGGGGDGLQLTRHHARGDADPAWEDGAGGAAAVVAVVGGDHGEGNFAIGEWVQGTLGAGLYLNLVADRSAVAAAMEDERVVWKHCLWVGGGEMVGGVRD